jgi:biotin synthase-related radical SAM superfamily protein
MAHSYAELRGMSVDELVQAYNHDAQHVELYAELVRREIALRDMEAQGQRMLQMTADVHQWTRVVKRLTWVITALTAVNVILVGLQLWKTFYP